MSISYQPKDSAVQGLQLKVQELVVNKSDAIVSVSGNDVIIDLKEPLYQMINGSKVSVAEIRAALYCSHSTSAVLKVEGVVGDTTLTITLPNPLADLDVLIVKYAVHK